MKKLEFYDHNEQCPAYDHGFCSINMVIMGASGHASANAECLEEYCPIFYWLNVEPEEKDDELDDD